MGSSRLTKKERKLRSKASRRRVDLKNQLFKPVIKNVDVDTMKKGLENEPSSPPAAKAGEKK